MKCKTCGAELEPVGRPKEFWQFYRCPNGCSDIFTTTTKIENVLTELVIALLLVLLLILLIPVRAIILLSEKIRKIIRKRRGQEI